ncbi:GyrI-like domain-containing protein [Paenibacillus lycopersici]|uniref:GyrI-like domain-containing protein n=1 Tax=Paenibacillus lycopersici TaxID=2704462 RepID=UPI001CDC5508|nr:GyrI-like domain-containing protein [Paenibacillus lycopersici]
MKFRIENKEAFQVIGLYNRVTPIESGEHPGVEQVWRSLDQDTYAKLNSLNDAGPRRILHVNVGEGVRAKDDYDYYLAVASTRPCPDRFKSYTVSAMTWAVFEMTVPWEKERWHRIYGEWFPSSGYEQIAGPTFQVGPEIEIGLERQVDSGIEHDVELWLPVAKVR